MKQIREEKDLSLEELSALCGSSEDFLESAEAATLEMTDDDLKIVHEIYWELAIGEGNPGDFKRLANERLATPWPDFGSTMREIRERKRISIGELSRLSGVSEETLKAAEAGNAEMTEEDDVQRVYWSLEVLEASAPDYRRLLSKMALRPSTRSANAFS
jgi:transcriptional regulator with XRE-family HTH domain